MEILIYLGIGIILGFAIGFFVGKFSRKSDENEVILISNLSSQIAEFKSKFEEMEKKREALEKEKAKLEEEKEKRNKEFMDNMKMLFNELKQSSKEMDEEKDKRIKSMIDQFKLFIKQQQDNIEIFLENQGKTREEIEKRRDAQIEDMKRMIETFNRTISGTKTRGIVGEKLLKEKLNESIKAGLIECNLKTQGGEVEFAWDLGDGKFIPIDSKFPDIFDILDKYDNEEDEKEREKYKKKIVEKIKNQIKKIKKYQNLPNTIDKCIMVVPEGVIEMVPEIIREGRKENVYICSYRDVLFMGYILHDEYVKSVKEGELGIYKQLVNTLTGILNNIESKLNTIERGLKMITNAYNDISGEIHKGKVSSSGVFTEKDHH